MIETVTRREADINQGNASDRPIAGSTVADEGHRRDHLFAPSAGRRAKFRAQSVEQSLVPLSGVALLVAGGGRGRFDPPASRLFRAEGIKASIKEGRLAPLPVVLDEGSASWRRPAGPAPIAMTAKWRPTLSRVRHSTIEEHFVTRRISTLTGVNPSEEWDRPRQYR